jgi:uncharacterized membrane protein YccF (DUF307 family)
MKYLKFFENVTGPQIGDYVIINFGNTIINKKVKNLEKICSQIIAQHGESFKIEFDMIGWWVSLDQIIDYDSDKKDLELRLIARKYNL